MRSNSDSAHRISAFEARLCDILLLVDGEWSTPDTIDELIMIRRIGTYILDHFTEADVCPICDGHGLVYEETPAPEGWQSPCPHCYGTPPPHDHELESCSQCQRQLHEQKALIQFLEYYASGNFTGQKGTQ